VRLSAAASALALAALAVLGIAAPASAHDQLLSTNPKDGSAVETLPAEVTLTFSDLVTDAGGEANQVRVLDSSCHPLQDGAPVIQDNVVTQKVSGTANGAVTVQWRVVSRDGHPVSGEFSFTVGRATSAASPSCDAAEVAGEPGSGGGSALPWIIGGVIVVVVVGGGAYLLATRSRRTGDQ